MKRIYIFDVDNTIYSNKLRKVLPNTEKLLIELSQNPDHILVFATGRGPAKSHVLGELTNLFTYQIYVNGAVTIKKNQIIDEYPINQSDIEQILNDASRQNISIGMVGFDQEAVSFFDENVSYAMKGYTDEMPLIDPHFHQKNKVYQLWLFNPIQEKLTKFAQNHPNFKVFLWHHGGIDLTYKFISKENALKKIIAAHPGFKVIAVGDGHNDINMIKLADIGIAMENSRFDQLKKEATLVAPDILKDELYDFFVQHQLI